MFRQAAADPRYGGGVASGLSEELSAVGTAVTRYATTLHAAIGDRHHVASPLGAWLILALGAPGTAGPDRDRLADILGQDPQRCARFASELLARPHPLIHAAVAAWSVPGAVSERWLSGLPDAVRTGEIPAQADLDGWARRHSRGLVPAFPARVDPSLLLLVASVLATKISWADPFDTAPASELGASSPWAGRLTRVLRTPAHGHVSFIAATPQAGDVAVHHGHDPEGLLVTSVIASQDVPSSAVLAAAHQLSRAQAQGEQAGRTSLFDLPLGEGPAWSIRERPSPMGDSEHVRAVLPAWSATSEHNLSDPTLGFAVLARSLTPAAASWEARQVAAARYSRRGFEAAAATTLATRVSARLPVPGRRREAVLRFAHPYAVVATATGPRPARDASLEDRPGQGVPGEPRPGPNGYGPWHNLPVFSAWVTEPDDVAEDA